MDDFGSLGRDAGGEPPSISSLNIISFPQVFTLVTLEMSKKHMPTLPWVLPMYEKMRQSLEGFMKNNSLPLKLQRAAAAGHSKLMGYYEKARGCQYNVIATGTSSSNVLIPCQS